MSIPVKQFEPRLQVRAYQRHRERWHRPFLPGKRHERIFRTSRLSSLIEPFLGNRKYLPFGSLAKKISPPGLRFNSLRSSIGIVICPLDGTFQDAICELLPESSPCYTAKVRIASLADDFYEDAFGEFAVNEMDYAVFHKTFQDLPRWGWFRSGLTSSAAGSGCGRGG